MKKVKIHKAKRPMYPTNSYSDRHYGYHCGGFDYDYCESMARDMARRRQNGTANYSVIEFAIIPFPGAKTYYVEDRSQYA